MLLIYARLESNCEVHIQRQAEYIFPNQQPSSLPTITLPHLNYKATMKPIAIHSQQEPLICTLTPSGIQK